MDCMEAMVEMKDNQYDLAIVDPPYFEDYGKENYPGAEFSKGNRGQLIKRNRFKSNHWDIPTVGYANELRRISVNQVVWGINYFDFSYCSGRIVWDKKNDSSSFSKCEIALISNIDSVQIFRYLWNGMLQENMKNKEKRIHPTQKPIALYKWLLQNYAKEGDKILDTHGGSMSIAIACWDMGYDLEIYEIDKNYYELGVNRFNNHCKQGQLF